MRRKTKILTAIGLLAALPVMILATGLLYLRFGDLSRHRSTVERLISDRLDRELRIAGEFEPHIWLTSSLEATDITLANVEWGSEPQMVTVHRLSASVDLWSLVQGPVHIHHLEIEGARVLVETSADGTVNWYFDTLKRDWHRPVTTREYVIDRAELKDVTGILRAPALDPPVELAIATLGFSSNQTDSVDLRLKGSLNGMALGLEGHLEPLSGLLTAGAVSFDYGGGLDKATFTTRGHIARLAGLVDPTFDLDLHGPDLAALTAPLGLPSPTAGPFQLEAHIEPSPSGSALALDAGFGELRATAQGSLDSLLSPSKLDVTVAASGPDLAAAGALAGIDRLPPDPFEIDGSLTWQEFPLTCEGLTLQVGGNSLSVDGVLGKPPRMLETDFTVRGEGPDVSSLAALFGLDLPADPFEVQARLLRLENGLQVKNVEARVGRTTLEADGFIGDPPEYDGTDLRASVRGPDLSRYSGLAGFDLPADPFEVSAHLSEDEDSISLQGVSARLGDDTAHIEGTVRPAGSKTEADLRLDAEGADLSQLTTLAGIDGIPAKPYRVAGQISIRPHRWLLNKVRAESDGMELEADGTLRLSPGLQGTELRLGFTGPDSSVPASLAGLDGVPPEPFAVRGTMRIVGNGYELEAVEVEAGSVHASVEGTIGPPPALQGTVLRVDGRGASLSYFSSLFGGTALPDLPFEVTGGLAVDETGLRLDSVELEVGPNRVSTNGSLVLSKNLWGSDVKLELQGRDLRETGGFFAAAGVEGIPELPAETFSVSGRVQIDEAGYLLQGVEGRVGSGVMQLDGRVGPLPECRGTDLTVLGNGPDAALFNALTGGEFSLEPFQLSGRVERPGTEFRFHDFTVRLGEYRAALSGTLGDPPSLAGTDLDFHIAGPGLGLPRKITELFDSHLLHNLPDRSFDVTGHCRGAPEDFTISRLVARLGESDFKGWFRLDLKEKPKIRGKLTSERVNLTLLLKQPGEVDGSAETSDVEPARGGSNLLIPDDPIDLAPLNRFDAEVSLSARELLLPHTRFSDIKIGARIENGALHVDPISATGSRGGYPRRSFLGGAGGRGLPRAG